LSATCADALEELVGDLSRVVARLGPAAPHLERDEHVLARGEAAERFEALERARDAEPRPPVGPAPGDIGAVEPHATTAGRLQAGDDVEERRLAGAVRPDEPGHASFGDRERRVVDRQQAAELHRYLVDLEQTHLIRSLPEQPGAVRRC
jgi:hypothetical protein